MEQDKLNNLTSVKPLKNKALNGSKEGNNDKFRNLYPSQQIALEKLSDWYHSKELECTLRGYAGTGKALLNGTPVLTPKGWVNIEDLKVGDLVATPYNSFAPVKGVYPQGERPLYKITFKDGRNITCDENHLWQVRTNDDIYKYHNTKYLENRDKLKYSKTTLELCDKLKITKYLENNTNKLRYSKTISTLELYDKLKVTSKNTIGGYRYGIPLVAVEGEHKNLPIHPYVLGVIISCGHLIHKWCKNNTFRLQIGGNKIDVIDKLASILNCKYYYVEKGKHNYLYGSSIEELNKILDTLSLKVKKNDRIIPNDYLFASKSQRLELLAGLIDSRGGVTPLGMQYISTSSSFLKNTIINLCHSLGYCVSIEEHNNLNSVIKISTSDKLFTCEKLLKQYNKYKRESHWYNDHLYIKSIEKLNYTGQTTCIAVDDDDKLFITKDYIVTHNTFILRYFLQHIVDKSYTITAPTHKALRVLEAQIGRKGMTLHSLHGLKPNIDLQNFDIENPQFDPLNPCKIQNYNLIVIDECSMINKDLFLLNHNKAKEFNTKILYVGDPLQLPPVNEDISPTFAVVKNTVELTDVVRQEEGNPLLELFPILRDDIVNKTNNFLYHIIRNRDRMENGIGYQILPVAQFKERLLEEFNSDVFHKNIDHYRIVAYTNNAVTEWNSLIRNSIVGKDADIIHINDLLLSYNTIVDEFKDPIILNSEDYIIEDIRPYISDERLKTFAVNLKSMYDGHITQPFLVVDSKEVSFERYKNILTLLYNRAANHEQHGWYVYYKFKNRFLTNTRFTINTVQGTKYINKDIDYGYAMTVHKTQGSTFDNVAIDLTNLVFTQTRYGRREVDIDIRNKLIYVALSRARNSVILKY